ncbi:MAG TPA: chromate efflux transporter [Opitutales bacterium]|jgi:chromate transporter|nr:chromate efflux transporter [Opitutales bacterium]
MPAPSPLPELAAVFFRLGCTCFGGPVAHLGYFHEEFVARRKWLDEAHFTDLVALCNFLPGPASSQVVFAIGMQRAGLAGAMVASLAFLLPSTVIMIAFGYGLAALGNPQAAGWLHGLKIAAAAVVAQAVWAMARRLCPDFPRALLGLAAAALVFFLPGPYTQIGAIAAGMAIGFLILKVSGSRFRVSSSPPPHASTQLETFNSKSETRNSKLKTSHAWAIAALGLYLLLLVLLPMLASSHSSHVFASFYRAGALVFGGGHVVLPLLRAEVVPPGWINDGSFLAGYGAAQALPGPLFSFAAYLGTVIFAGSHAWLGGLLCLLAIYLPAWLVIGGALPFWHTLRAKTWAQGALRGANAAVVGILLAALITPIGTEAIGNWLDLAAAIAAFILLDKFRAPPWAVVLLAAVFGGLL